MSAIAKVEPLFIRKGSLSREVVCRVTVYEFGHPPQAHVRYFPVEINTTELEAEIVGQFGVNQVQVQACFWLPEVDDEFPF